MTFEKLKDFLNTMSEEDLFKEIQIKFNYSTKSSSSIKEGIVSGIIYENDSIVTLFAEENSNSNFY